MKISNFGNRELLEIALDRFETAASGDAKDEKKGATLEYLSKYLEHLGARWIVVEDGYIDAGYLEDYGRYYSRCFAPRGKTTRRVHFFKNFSNERKDASEYADSIDFVKDVDENSYLGFVILRPLNSRYIGRTCLKNYSESPEEHQRRKRRYPIKRHYRIGLMGREFKVDSVAYQEQDAEVAACATISIWSTLHASYKDFAVARIPSPYEITAMAIDGSSFSVDNSGSVRQFPNDGLTIQQMQTCLVKLGYHPLLEGLGVRRLTLENHAARKELFNQTLEAYLNAKVPILVVGWSYYATKSENVRPGEKSFRWTDGEQHAITVLGYSHELIEKRSRQAKPFTWRSDLIDRIYAHDDGVGPFARYEWVEYEKLNELGFTPSNEDSKRGHGPCLVSYFGEALKDADRLRVISPWVCLIPLNKKMRTDLWPIRREMGILKAALVSAQRGPQKADPNWLSNLHWVIELADVSALKKRLLTDPIYKKLTVEEQSLWLNASLPRHIWVASIANNEGGTIVMSILFDATALKQDFRPIGIIHSTDQYDDYICSVLVWYAEEIRKDCGSFVDSNDFLNSKIVEYLEFESKL